MKKSTFLLFTLFISLLSGCATIEKELGDVNLVPNVLKTQARINFEISKSELKKATEAEELSRTAYEALSQSEVFPIGSTPTLDVIKSRKLYLKSREDYVVKLQAELNSKIAVLEMKATRSGYLKLGSRGAGVTASVVSAVLVTASPANAATVAGLAAFSGGLISLEDTASEVGYSAAIAEGQIGLLKDSVKESFEGFKEVSWDKLYAASEIDTGTAWALKMDDLGRAIVKFEAVVRYTKFEVRLVIEPVDS